MPAVSESMYTAPAGTRGSILLVEDNLINQQVALGILQIQGYSVAVANNGREALDAYAKGAFDLILMDCHMPEMDGFEATLQLRAGGNRVRIIALTASAMEDERAHCFAVGMDDFLSKPLTAANLRDALGKVKTQAAA